jgi:Fe-S oxidoreductase
VETIIAATGVSCRQQIEHGTGRPAQHPLEVIRQVLLAPSSTQPGVSAD